MRLLEAKSANLAVSTPLSIREKPPSGDLAEDDLVVGAAGNDAPVRQHRCACDGVEEGRLKGAGKICMEETAVSGKNERFAMKQLSGRQIVAEKVNPMHMYDIEFLYE